MDQRFLDLVERRLPPEDMAYLEEEISSDPILAQEFAKYRAVTELERLVACESAELDEDLSDAVMSEIAAELGGSAVDRKQRRRYRGIIGALSSVNAVLTVMLAVLFFADRPPSATDLRANLPELHIPPGYRPVSIDVALPLEQVRAADLRLDLRVQYGDQVSELAEFLKVVAIKTTDNGDMKTSKLIVLAPERIAQQINYARILAELDATLITAGADGSQPPRQPEPAVTTQPVRDLNGRMIVDNLPGSSIAVLYLPDRRQGTLSRHVLHQGEWLENGGVRVHAF